MENEETIVFGGGCFWCTEAVFDLIKGVSKTTPGYAGGKTKNPTYDEVCEGNTGHAEVLKIDYNPKEVSLEKLLEVFFKMHDPTSLNRQDADLGTQYRSIILYNSDGQRKIIEPFIKDEQANFPKPIVTEVKKLERFYPAEDYHKKFYENNPGTSYCKFVVKPKVEKIKKEFHLE
jgi:peptide-methionine (S)-S-oxide reductase